LAAGLAPLPTGVDAGLSGGVGGSQPSVVQASQNQSPSGSAPRPRQYVCAPLKQPAQPVVGLLWSGGIAYPAT